MARIKVQKSQLYYFDGTEIIAVQCAKNLTLGTDTEEDIDVTCLDDEEDNFDPGKKTPGEGTLDTDFDDENDSHLKLLALSKSDPRKKVMWYLGSSHSTDAPTVVSDVVSTPTTRMWWVWEGYLKTPDRTFEKSQFVGYNYPLKRTSGINEVMRTIPPVGP
ncbi:phage tail tube protein [Acinetobacter sp. YH12251]|uniref:phage tail tube protein n=1 Tax=Acinetobacter sp. YH12251 TaxID=2601176 RepID=UPI0015D18FA8|nr:phage tail tube protein [Acinetobacter sp. YH12251]